jgi:hypothetical protein
MVRLAQPFDDGIPAASMLLMSRGNKVPDFLDAYVEHDDFKSFDADDDWVVTNATAGTADVIDGAGGILELDAASSTADQGIQIQRKIETFLPAANKDILFECRLKVTDTIDKVQLFAGLSVLDTTIFASGEPTSTDYIGFLLDATEQAGANANKPSLELNSTAGSEEKGAAAATLVEATYIRLGFLLTGITRLTPIIDGVPGTSLAITDCPVTEMAASFACLSEGTNDPITSLDWYYAVQLR